jgi:hypothetical protein
MKRYFLALSLCAGLLAFAQHSTEPGEGPGHHHEGEQLGTVSFPTSCAPAVQKSFARGVALLHSFEYEEAGAQFAAVAKRDPGCAMAHWGVAMSLWHQLWEVPPQASLTRGAAEIRQAQALHPKTARERGYIDALAAFYTDTAREQDVRAKAFSDAMETVYRQNPDDHEAAAFYALSLLSSAPPDDATFANEKKAVAILDPLFAQYPDHPGLAHYIIHACDRPQLAALGLNAARRYAAIAPSSAHALHMPSHIFARLGLWQEDIKSNLASIAATKKTMAMNMGGADHQLHATHFLIYALLQVGDDKQAKQWVDGGPAVADAFRHAQHRNSTDDVAGYANAGFPALYALETHRWSDAAALEAPAGAKPSIAVETMWARTIGSARVGDGGAARRNAARYEALLEQMSGSDEAYAVKYLDVQRKEVEAWADFAETKNEDALRLLRAAADQQDAVGKGEVEIPAREMLGDMLLALDRPQDALAEYETSMKVDPNRFNGLFGAAQAAEAAHQPDKARTYYAALLKNCANVDSDRPELARAREALGKEATAQK